MASPYHTEFEERKATKTQPRPKLRTKGHSTPAEEKSFKWPSLPGKPRKVHKGHGRRVKTRVQEEI